MGTRPTLCILGAAGGAREVWYAVYDTNPLTELVFIDDHTDITEVKVAGRTLPVCKDWNLEPWRKGDSSAFTEFLIGLGTPIDKKVMVEKALEKGLTPAPTLCDRTNILHPDATTLGRGGVIIARSVLSSGVVLGDYVHIMTSTIGHDAKLDMYSSCFAGCHVSGEVHLGEGTLLGAGVVVRDECKVAPWTVVGAGGVVVKDVTEPGMVMGGVPAKPLKPITEITHR